MKINLKNGEERKSQVSAAKILQVLAPNFFPLWDNKIAKEYRCSYENNPEEKYLEFCYLNKEIVSGLERKIKKPGKTILKIIDEYNYSKFTKD